MAKVDDVSATVQAMLDDSAPVRDVVAGTRHLRKLGETYLPQFPMETTESYKARRDSSWCFNGVKKARDDMVGKIFERPVTVSDGAPDQVTDWMNNVDLEGRDLSNFLRDVCEAGFDSGISFIYVDAPPRPGGDMTRGEVQMLNLRPYMVHLPLSSVLGWAWSNVANAPTLTQFRIMERVADPDRGPYSDAMIEQVRELSLEEGRVVVRLWQREGDKKKEFVVVEEYGTDMDEITVAPFYTGRTGFFKAKTPLSDIADVNLAHWRIQSDKTTCLHKALAPVLLFKGVDIEGQIAGAADAAFQSNNEFAEITYTEIGASGIDAASRELAALEQQMRWLGVRLMAERVGSTTATDASIEEGKSLSRLEMWADNLKDATEIALGWMMDLAGIDGEVEVVVHKDFDIFGNLTMQDVHEYYRSGAISQETYLKEGKRRGVLAEDVDPETEDAQSESDALALVS